MFRVYYYGLHKWENYLLDIDEDVRTSSESSQALAREASGLHETFRSGFEGLRVGIEGFQNGIEDLRADFQWGFSLLADRMDTQISIMAGIASKLDAINTTLGAPLDTQARELFRIGVARLREGLDDKALEAFLQSEQKNDVDFALQLYIGKLFLEGTNVINLQKAAEHLLLAARYAEAKRGRLDGWNRYAAEAYYHAAIAAYLEGERAYGDGNQSGVNTFLQMALGFLSKAWSLNPEFLEIEYTRAKCSALLGKTEDVRQCFEFLADRDRRYFLKTTEDQDFFKIRELVKEVADRALANPGPLARQTAKRLEIASAALTWAKSVRSQQEGDLTAINAIDQRIEDVKRILTTLDVDLVGWNSRLDVDTHRLESIASRALHSNLETAKARLVRNENVVTGLRSEMGRQQSDMRDQTGCLMGCLFTLLAPFCCFILYGFLVLSFPKYSAKWNSLDTIVENLLFLIALVAGITATVYSRARQRAPHRKLVADAQKEIAKRMDEKTELEGALTTASSQLNSFMAWYQQNQS